MLVDKLHKEKELLNNPLKSHQEEKEIKINDDVIYEKSLALKIKESDSMRRIDQNSSIRKYCMKYVKENEISRKSLEYEK